MKSFTDEEQREVIALCDRAGAPAGTFGQRAKWLVNDLKQKRDEGDQLAREIPVLQKRVIELEQLATEGRAYREQLLTEAIEQGQRAIEGFDVEAYKELLETSATATMKQLRDDWKKTADKRGAPATPRTIRRPDDGAYR